MKTMSYESIDPAPTAKKITALVLVAAIISGLISGLVGAYIFARPGSQGIQGEPGLSGSDSIIQVVKSQNLTTTSLVAYPSGQWHNMSLFDSSTRLTINVQNGSQISVRFLSSATISSSGTISLKIVVDNQYSSIVYNAGIQPAVTLTLPIQVEILTDALPAGEHTIEVQLLRNTGTQVLLERTLFVSEMTSS